MKTKNKPLSEKQKIARAAKIKNDAYIAGVQMATAKMEIVPKLDLDKEIDKVMDIIKPVHRELLKKNYHTEITGQGTVITLKIQIPKLRPVSR